MCGLLGYVGAGSRAHSPRLEGALELLRHRGPDGGGQYANEWLWAGHKRLAILDLSEAALQPYFGRDRRTLLLFNGEIFNYRELAVDLRREGVDVQASGDTAVLMAALDTWGVARTLPRLNGFWAFAFIDLVSRQVTLSRDRFGVKPLYFAQPARGELVFASEPKAIIAAFPQFRRPSDEAISGFIAGGRFFEAGQSFYEGVQVFPSASTGAFTPGSPGVAISRFWDYPQPCPDGGGVADPLEEFSALFEDAVRVRYRSDVPVGITASGGVDSTAILLASSKSDFDRLTAFTSVYDVGSAREHEHARRVCDLTGLPLQYVTAREDQWLTTLQSIAGFLDSPTASPAVFPLFEICRTARSQGVIVLLEGQGADEAFGGYVQHAAAWALDVLHDGRNPLSRFSRLAGALPGLQKSFGATWMMLWMAKLAGPAWFRHFASILFPRPAAAGAQAVAVPDAVVPLAPAVRDPIPGAGARLNALLRKEHGSTILPTLLHYGDAISMANSVEMRQPFLDYRLVEWIFRQPDRTRFTDGRSKWIVREYLDRHGGAFVNRWRKEGYTTPLPAWIRRNRRTIVEDILCAPGSRTAQEVPAAHLRSLVGRASSGSKTAAYHVFRLMSLELWLKAIPRITA